MRLVVAVGGNALLRRGEPMTIGNQQINASVACERLARVAVDHDLAVTHGNGPQVGLLALEDATDVGLHLPLDVLVAESQGMVGHLLERELTSRLPAGRAVVALLTMVEVDGDDPSFTRPSKPIGPPCPRDEAAVLERERGWVFARDGDALRRVVASPAPIAVLEERAIATLLDAECVVICAGGGGVAVVRDTGGALRGVEAVIDKDHVSALLAEAVGADMLVLATDVDAVYLGFGTPAAAAVRAAHPDALLDAHQHEFAPGSMLPKVTAACAFARATGRPAMIGSLDDIEGLVAGTVGTRVSTGVTGVVPAGRGEGR